MSDKLSRMPYSQWKSTDPVEGCEYDGCTHAAIGYLQYMNFTVHVCDHHRRGNVQADDIFVPYPMACSSTGATEVPHG